MSDAQSHSIVRETRPVPLAELNLYYRNPRRGDISAIAASLARNGQYRAVVVNVGSRTGRPNEVLCGNHTVMSARLLDWDTVDASFVDLDDTEAARVVLADNRTSELATDDSQVLAELLQEFDGDLEGTGWEPADLDALLEELRPDTEDPAGDALPEDTEPAEPPADPVTRPGDVWLLGPHRVLCGDARDDADAAVLLDGVQVTVAFTSPPYASQREYDESSGFKPIPPDEYVDWFDAIQANVRHHLAADGSWFVNIKAHVEDGQRHLYVQDLVIAHARRWGWRFVDDLCWTRPGVPGRWPDRFKNGWEPVFHFAPGRAAVKFRPEAVGHESESIPVRSSEIGANSAVTNGAYWNRSKESVPGIALPGNVLAVAGVDRGTGHTAAYPIGLPTWFLRAYSDAGDAVFDPFMGSGTTLIAAHNEDRIAYGTEISPAYCDVIARRFQRHTGIVPLRVPAGGGEPVPHTFADTP